MSAQVSTSKAVWPCTFDSDGRIWDSMLTVTRLDSAEFVAMVALGGLPLRPHRWLCPDGWREPPVPGGCTRFPSVAAALDAVAETGMVGAPDGAEGAAGPVECDGQLDLFVVET